MNRRLAVAALVVVLASGSVAALVADPLASRPEPGTVDATAESPGEFVLEVLQTPERRSFQLTQTWYESNEEVPRVVRARVDRDHRRVASTVVRTPWEYEAGRRAFANECNSASRSGRYVSLGFAEYWYYGKPFSPGPLAPADLDARVVTRTDDRVVVRVANATAALSLVTDGTYPREEAREDDLRGNLTVTWDADRGVLDRVELVDSSMRNETHRVTDRRVWNFQQWGGVHVERPGWAGVTQVEFVCDATTFRT